MTNISGVTSASIPPSLNRAAVTNDSARPATASDNRRSVTASDVFASGKEANDFISMQLSQIAGVAAGLEGDKWTLANLDAYVDGYKAAGLSDEDIQVRQGRLRELAEEQITSAQSFLAGASERFGPGFQVTGSVVQKNEAGDWQMGDFSIASKGDGFALRMDRENGLMVKDANGAWRQDSTGTAALRLLEEALARPPRALDQLV